MPGDNENTEPTIEESALDSSLDALLKAAGAEDTLDQLKKGGQVYSGHYDERGKVGGGGASQSDAGGLDNMMIGKLVAGGMDGKMARQVVGDLMGMLTAGGLVGKQKDEDEDEDEDDEEMTAYARGYMEAMKKMGKSADFDDDDDEDGLVKSHRESFTEEPEIGEAVDASPFMDQLVTRTTKALDGLSKSIRKGEAKQGEVNRAMARALYEQGQLIKSQAGVIDELGSRLGMVERQPAGGPKGARTAGQAQALAKSLPGEVGGGSESERLSKSQAASVLSYLRFEKGMQNINGEPTGDAACRAEAGGVLSKSMDEYIQKYLATHPNEREAALNYA